MESKKRVAASASGSTESQKRKKQENLKRPLKQLFNLVLEGGSAPSDGKKILRVHVQFSKDFEMQSFHLGTVQLKENPVGYKYIKTEIQSLLSEAGLKEEQIYATLVDYAPFLVPGKVIPTMAQNQQPETNAFSHVMSELGAFGRMGLGKPRFTFVHYIQVAVNKFLSIHKKDLMLMEDEYRILNNKAPKWITTQCDAEDYQPNEGLWNTPFLMLDCLLDARKTIGSKLPETTWILAESLHRALSAVSYRLKVEGQTTCGDLLQQLKGCEKELEIHQRKISASLAANLKSATEALKSHYPFQMSLYFDPRHNNRKVCNVDQKNIAVEFLLTLYPHICKLEGKDVPENVRRERKSAWPEKKSNYGKSYYSEEYGREVSAEFEESSSAEEESDEEPETFKDRIYELENRSAPGTKFKIAEYWKKLQRSDAEMAKLANIATSVPVTGMKVDVLMPSEVKMRKG